MVHSCCVVGCTARQAPGMSLHRIPSHPERRRMAWLRKIRRVDWQPTSSTRICGRHFMEGKPIDNADHPDYIPCKDMPGADTKTGGLQRYQRLERRRLEQPAHHHHHDAPCALSQTQDDSEAAATLLDLADAPITGDSRSFQSTGSQTVTFHDEMEVLLAGKKKDCRLEEALAEARKELTQLRAENQSLTDQLRDAKFTFSNIRIEDFVFFYWHQQANFSMDIFLYFC